MILTMIMRVTKIIRRYGPVLAAIVLVVIGEQVRGTDHFTLSPLFAILAIGIYNDGLVSGTLIGLLISGYSLYAISDISQIRALIIIASVVTIVIPFAIMRRTLDNTDTIVIRLREIDILLAGAIDRWRNLGEGEKVRLINQLHHKVANLQTLVAGWVSLARERDEVLSRYKRDE